MKSALLKHIIEARSNRQAVAVVTDLGSGEQHLIAAESASDSVFKEAVDRRLKSSKSGVDEIEGKETFIQVYVPPPRMVIIGAVHISQALVPMAQACGFDVSVIDPRTSFASAERFPGVKLMADWPENVLEADSFDPFTAVVAITHDPKIDDLPLKMALDAGCFYVGALGSRKTHGKRVDRLKESGIDEALLERIHAPIGLDIRAASPAEIAVAIMGEVIANLRRDDPR